VQAKWAQNSGTGLPGIMACAIAHTAALHCLHQRIAEHFVYLLSLCLAYFSGCSNIPEAGVASRYSTQQLPKTIKKSSVKFNR
jgi:hypothetical protein